MTALHVAGGQVIAIPGLGDLTDGVTSVERLRTQLLPVNYRPGTVQRFPDPPGVESTVQDHLEGDTDVLPRSSDSGMHLPDERKLRLLEPTASA